jgi:hypothetical protein
MKPVKENSNNNKPEGGGNSRVGNKGVAPVVKANNPKGVSSDGNGKGNNKNNNSSSEGNNNGKKEDKRDFRGNRRWRGNRSRDRDKNKDRDRDIEKDLDPNRIIYKCEICDKEIKDITSAIDMKDSHNPVHFDCMLDKIKKENSLEGTDKVVYLGAGNFGIVRIEKGKSGKDFKIMKKLEIENRDEKPEWRTLQIKAR